MQSNHRLIRDDARRMAAVEDQSIDLVVTSPPYPMIEMWDPIFSEASPAIETALGQSDGDLAFDLMHQHLDEVWQEVARTVKPGGIACINIGDATRTLNKEFRLFANHARIISALLRLDFSLLPSVIWRKPTNSPTKFMGSGMLPAGAYVTLEHEYILIFRKAGKRDWSDEALKQQRRESAYFWEERNLWFSDVWFDLKGTSQELNNHKTRERSGAFPLELPYRLINMYSMKGDRVLDPFLGTGTTMQAAMCLGRESLGYEVDPELQTSILQKIADVPDLAKELLLRRLQAHMDFVQDRANTHGVLKYQNRHYGFPVMTRQEQELRLEKVQNVRYLSNERFQVFYGGQDASGPFENSVVPVKKTVPSMQRKTKGHQLKLF